MKERPLLDEKRAVQRKLNSISIRIKADIRESDDVAEKVLGDLAIAIATESKRVAAVRDCDNRDDGLREILASIADQQIALGRCCRVDLPHLLRIAIDPAVNEIRCRTFR
jgi:hypothetical protein